MSRNKKVLVAAMMVSIIMIASCKRGNEQAPTEEKVVAAATTPAVDAAPVTTCKVEILNWNPKEISPGQQFNVQKSGDSAYWVKVTPESQGFEASVDGQPVKLTYGTGLVTFLHQGPLVAAAESKDKINVDFTCEGASADSIEIQVKR